METDAVTSFRSLDARRSFAARGRNWRHKLSQA